MDIVLNLVEVRVLGSLFEKERLVPDNYPLTLNMLVTSCNQATSRHPVMEVTRGEVEEAVSSLKAKRLVRRVLPNRANEVMKVRQVADEALALDEAERALLTVLLLRAAQTSMELRSRTARLHPFVDTDEVEAVLAGLAGRDQPLVRQLPPRPRQRQPRWAHLLAGEPR